MGNSAVAVTPMALFGNSSRANSDVIAPDCSSNLIAKTWTWLQDQLNTFVSLPLIRGLITNIALHRQERRVRGNGP